MKPLKILVTRAEPTAAHSVHRLKDAGFQSVVLPMFQRVDTGVVLPDETSDGYVFTSRNALATLEERNWECFRPEVVAYCVGNRTAAEAKSRGFVNIVSANGDGKALAGMIAERERGKNSQLTYFAGKDRSFDLEGALSETDIQISLVELYEIAKVIPSDDALRGALDTLGSGAVFLYSKRTASHVCEVICGQNCETVFKKLSAIAISAKTAEAVLKYPWQAVYVADEPTEPSMINKLSERSLA